MKIKLVDFGVQKDYCPFRPHGNDAGADVFMPFDCKIKSGEILKTFCLKPLEISSLKSTKKSNQ